jgi:E3 ubiquitin-protein ligase UBR2
MLFNDEIHTYEQVISTLSRAIDCSQKEAIDFATTIDREGRSIVKCCPFQVCSQVKGVIERITSRHGSKPLRVEVMLVALIAHQTFSMRLLTWLQGVLTCCEAFRSIFSSIITEPFDDRSGSEASLLEHIMRADVSLWKTARNQWHQLFITGLLMESSSKKIFAKIFTRIYSTLMKDFVTDDHEHSVSITSLSVQLFTVPSLGHSLIAEDDALLILIKAFLEECRKYLNHDGKLQFERNHAQMMNFRRSQYILIDLRYLLSAKPVMWTDDLRKNFMHAFTNLIDLLEWMQGMDAVVRQVGQHVEFEAEWETGINLQLKLAHVISLIIEWAGSDRIVLLKSLRHAMKELVSKQGKMTTISRSLKDVGIVVDDLIEYDVATLPVSVHLPLTRVVAGLLLHMTRYDVNYNSPDFLISRKSSLPELMELPLRTLVMIAQFRAGMWRRNGYSLVNQVYFYHNVRLREEMYDRDILMLQYVAALTDADEFLVHLVNKFQLWIQWSSESYAEAGNRKPEEDYLRQTITLIEEFLSLILVLVSERYTPGVGKVTSEERVKKEIIQWLCVEPTTHSDLLRLLPKESSNDVIIETLISEVASFKRPGCNQAGGKYEVRPEFLSLFNPFFYHYTRQDQSAAEEVQVRNCPRE